MHFMNLDSSTILLTNSTVIIGLLILITFQSFGSFTETTVEQFYISSTEIALEQEKLEKIISWCNDIEVGPYSFESYADKICTDEHHLRLIELNAEMSAIRSLVKLGNLEDESGNSTLLLEFIRNSGFVINLINFVMILPFTLSSIFEIKHYLGKENESNSSKKAIKTLLIGFIILLIGIILMISLMFCVSNPHGCL